MARPSDRHGKWPSASDESSRLMSDSISHGPAARSFRISYDVDGETPSSLRRGVSGDTHRRTSSATSMNSSIHTWQAAIQGMVNDADENASAFSSDLEQEGSMTQNNMNFVSQVAFWGKDTLINCVCGASPESYCTCLPTSLDFIPGGDCFQQPPIDQNHSVVTISESNFSTIEPKVQEHPRPALPARKERRRQQNRAAQVRHRDKRNRFLHETLRNIEAMNEELKQTRAQRDYFRLMYEDLETQMMQLSSQSSSRLPSSSPTQS